MANPDQQPGPNDPNGEVIPNIHPDMYIAVSLLAFVLSTLAVSLRFYVRAIMIKAFGRDDWALLAAWFIFTCHCFMFVAYGVIIEKYGLYAEFFPALGIFQFHGLLYSLDQAMVKIALGLFFLKLLPNGGWQAMTIKISVIIFTLFTVIFGFVTLFQCGDPLDLSNPDPKCLSLDALEDVMYLAAAFNMSMDWLMTLMPISVIWGSQMSQRTKLSVVFIMMLGALASIISLIRIPLMNLGLLSGYMGFKTVTPYLMLALWENGVGIIAVSLAALRPLVRRIVKGSSVNPTYEAKTEAAHLSRYRTKNGITVATGFEIEDIDLEERGENRPREF